MSMELLPEWMAGLEEEDVVFIKKFVLASGSLKEVAPTPPSACGWTG